MSRSGYSADCDGWALIRWRGAVASAIKGKRGQAFLREMLGTLDALPERKLIADDLEVRRSISHWGIHDTGEVCAIGSVGRARGIDMDVDPDDREHVAELFGVSSALVAEIADINDSWYYETPEQRFVRVRAWVAQQIVDLSRQSEQAKCS